ncbi:hypothetical protein C4580_04855 [Candidatus Woesearchaeota archaeon]|nr:MAG: hypothetical protein C4580_04855 [Candidatus Woesearchaeota archaeon]
MEVNSKVVFGDEKIKNAYEALSSQKFQEKQLQEWVERAFLDLQKNAFSGIQIPKRIIPKDYQSRFVPLDNLWKYNLPNAWRLIYTIKRDKIIVLSIVLEWLSHKEYERRFNY